MPFSYGSAKLCSLDFYGEIVSQEVHEERTKENFWKAFLNLFDCTLNIYIYVYICIYIYVYCIYTSNFAIYLLFVLYIYVWSNLSLLIISFEGISVVGISVFQFFVWLSLSKPLQCEKMLSFWIGPPLFHAPFSAMFFAATLTILFFEPKPRRCSHNQLG